MFIHSLRYGFANNSSSTHSILLRAKLHEVDTDDFGWSWFHLTSPVEKARYMLAQVVRSLRSYNEGPLTDDVLWNGYAQKFFPDLYSELAFTPEPYSIGEYQSITSIPYVDHDSAWGRYPVDFWNEGCLHEEFFREAARELVYNPETTILGGNDNGDCPYSEALLGEEHPLSHILRGVGQVIRKEADGHFVTFQRGTGTKTRISFGERAVKPWEVAATPELVDVKITDACRHGCAYCYQGSTPEGKHADKHYLSQLFWALNQLKVFEVAIGGGEPTQHPDFAEILRDAKGKFPAVNLTTFRVSNLREHEKAIRENVSSIGLSVTSSTDIKEAWAWNNDVGFKGPRITLQLVAGMTGQNSARLLEQADALGIGYTLLGFKHHFRGVTYKKRTEGWIEPFLREKFARDKHASFGADSVFVNQYGHILDELGIPRVVRVSKEGAFSCYVDAVEQYLAPCSYTEHRIPLTLERGQNSHDLAKAVGKHFPFREWEIEAEKVGQS